MAEGDAELQRSTAVTSDDAKGHSEAGTTLHRSPRWEKAGRLQCCHKHQSSNMSFRAGCSAVRC